MTSHRHFGYGLPVHHRMVPTASLVRASAATHAEIASAFKRKSQRAMRRLAVQRSGRAGNPVLSSSPVWSIVAVKPRSPALFPPNCATGKNAGIDETSMRKKGFDFTDALYLMPLALFHVAVFWFPSAWFSTTWGLTSYWVIAAVLLLPWLKTRIYREESLGKIVLLEVTGIATFFLLMWMRREGGRAVDIVILICAAVALILFALQERRRHQQKRDRPA